MHVAVLDPSRRLEAVPIAVIATCLQCRHRLLCLVFKGKPEKCDSYTIIMPHLTKRTLDRG